MIFDCLNSHEEYWNGELTLNHFLYYFQVTCSSSSNRLCGKASSSKPSSKKGKEKVVVAAKGKGVADRTIGDPDYYSRWLIR